jgi:ABC-type antimicrobial peptide transport system permease subunit
MFIIAESAFVALIGGLLGVGFATLLINGALGPFVEENSGGMFLYFRVASATPVVALGLALLLGILGAAIPGYRASKLNVIDAIRRVG